MLETEKFLFFYGGFCSQWVHSPFVDNDSLLWFNTAEQWMMYKKAKFFNDESTAALIMETKHPREQKRLGRSTKNYNEAKWDKVKYDIVFRGNVMKFTQNSSFGKALLGTGDKTIVEASPTDAIWGIKLGLENPDILDPHKWKGQNLLGKIIMDTRDVLNRKKAYLARLDLLNTPLVNKDYL